jgi:arylsulfatase A-like enzyme
MNSDSRNASQSALPFSRLGPSDVLVLSGGCGLLSGEGEVAARIVYSLFSPTNGLLMMTRHFVWLVPLIDLLLFFGIGSVLAWAIRLWPRRAGWASTRIIVALAVLPVLVECGRGIYPEAWFLFAIGIAVWLSPWIERHGSRMRRMWAVSIPILLAAVMLQALWLFGSDRLKQWREDQRPFPEDDRPNVLLVVLDTVRADHLSLYGYERPTTPNLQRLAARGIRFDQARTAAPWTLASHASMFTGRWPHELNSGWMQPLRGDVPTLAEFLGSLGYATAGFVGNTFYCSYDSGLGRGFTRYRDYVVDTLAAVRTVRLVDDMFNMIAPICEFLSIKDLRFRQFIRTNRKHARDVNRELLDWLSHRREPRRPFFGFINYADAHSPYVLPGGEEYRFGVAPSSYADFFFLLEGWSRVDKRRLSQQARSLARDSYDNCVAYIDECFGELLDELGRRGLLDRTFLIVAADHGEGFGEHELFDHGESLYRMETRVPLLVVPPGGRGRSPAVVEAFVSLRDLPTTIAEVVRPGAKSPFAGRSLTRFFRDDSTSSPATVADELVLSELSSPNPTDPNQGRSPAYRGPLVSLAEGDFVYVYNEGDGSEELFNERDDQYELINHANAGSMLPTLRRFRDRLREAKASVRQRAGPIASSVVIARGR